MFRSLPDPYRHKHNLIEMSILNHVTHSPIESQTDPCRAGLPNSTRDTRPIMAQWLEVADVAALIQRAQTRPWEGTLSDVALRRVSISSKSNGQPTPQHEIIWCPRPEDAAAVHVFQLGMNEAILEELRALARNEMSMGESEETASNVGGFHGARELWRHLPASVQSRVSACVQQASAAEAAQLERAPVPTSADEAWFNVLDEPGGWNMLHTHPGSAFSGVVYVDAPTDASSASDPHALAGRLALVPGAYADFAEDEDGYVTYDGFKLPPPSMEHATTAREVLLIDPVPGVCVVFPSATPHFVFPTATTAETTATARRPLQRISIAFNFGECEPVIAHLHVRGGDGGARVSLLLECVGGLAFRMPPVGKPPSAAAESSASSPVASAASLPPSASARGEPPAKRPRVETKRLCEQLEARRCSGGGRGNGVFAATDVAAGWLWKDHAICVPATGATPPSVATTPTPPPRRLPAMHNADELMEALATDGRFNELLSGPWQMSHCDRHLAMQDTTDDTLPEWAHRVGMCATRYNLLAAQIQSQVAREEDGDGLVMLPCIRFANHACGPAANAELCYAPNLEADSCECGLGHYALRALTDIRAGEEVVFSYIGSRDLMAPEQRAERQALLHRRWGFSCECALCGAGRGAV